MTVQSYFSQATIIGMVGLGKMGMNMVRLLLQKGLEGWKTWRPL